MTTSQEKSAPTFASLGLPDEVKELTQLPAGVVLVSGKLQTGKSETLKAMAASITDRKVVRVVDDKELKSFHYTELGIENYLIKDRDYKGPLASANREKLALARRYCVTTASDIMNAGAQVVFFDDLSHPESAMIADLLAECGILVVASIHAGVGNFLADPTPALDEMSRLMKPLVPRFMPMWIVQGVVSQRFIDTDRGRKFEADVFTNVSISPRKNQQ